jgi:hypothetical protein
VRRGVCVCACMGAGGWRMWFVCWHCGTAGLEEHRGTCHFCSRVRRSNRRCCIGSRSAVFLLCCVATVVSRVATQRCRMSTSSYPLRRKSSWFHRAGMRSPTAPKKRTCNMHRAPCSMQHASHNIHTTCHHATDWARDTTCGVPCSACNLQQAACNVHHAI